MNFSTQCTVDTQILRDFVYTFPATHVATLNLAHGYRNIHGARKVCSNFVYKFNSAIWGRDGWKSRERILGVMPVIHNRRNVDVCHLHLAFYGFPERLTEDAISCRYYNTAKHTQGVQYELHGQHHVDFGVLTGGWLSYMTRKIKGLGDENLLIEFAEMPGLTSGN